MLAARPVAFGTSFLGFVVGLVGLTAGVSAAEPVVLPAAAPPPVTDPGPLVGVSEKFFVRTPGNDVVVFPGARLQIDGAFFPRQSPKSGAYIRRARVELAGWFGPSIYFTVSADFAQAPAGGPETFAPSMLAATDNYLAIAPFGDRLILQVGQFDAPFTLENRTSDAYTDFIERSMAVRALVVPRNKEVGAMLHGIVGGLLYYSGGVFNGEGPGFRNGDNQPDAIGRVVVSPFGRGDSGFRRLSVGGSGWYGRHVLGPMFPTQATPGGVRFLVPRWVSGDDPARTLELREHGTVMAAAGEVNLPIGTRLGVRAEGVWKRQELAEAQIFPGVPGATPLPLGSARLQGIGAYGEIWLWVIGSERLLPAPGLQLPFRLTSTVTRPSEDGLMLAFRAEVLKEDLITNQPTLGDPTRATTRVLSGTAGINYWRGHFARFSVNYIVHHWSGTSETIKALQAASPLQHEVLVRFATSL